MIGWAGPAWAGGVPSDATGGDPPDEFSAEAPSGQLDGDAPGTELADNEGAARESAVQDDTDGETARFSDGDGLRIGNVDLAGSLTQETAYRLDQPHVFTKIRQQAVLAESTRLTDELSLYARQRVWYDAVYDLADNFPKSAERGMEWEYELRETYLDYSRDEFDVRLGKQQIVWGESVGLFFADVVNAKDLREYVLPDFEWIRIPQWGADVEWSHDDMHVEFVWLPVLQFNRLGPSGSEFEFPYPVPAGATFSTVDPSTPPSSFNNGEVGLRLSTLSDGWDLSGFYLYTWDKSPIPFRQLTGGTFQFHPDYERAHLWGATLSKELADVVLRGEMVVNPHQSLVTFDPRDPDGILERGALDYVLGAGYTFFDRLQTNVQWMQRWIPGHRDLMQEDDVRTHLSLWAKMELLDGKIEPECLVLTGVTEVDMLYRPQITYNATDSLEVTVGADVFQGDAAGLFGRFDERSRVYTEVTYHF
jgi:hypothetical protein